MCCREKQWAVPGRSAHYCHPGRVGGVQLRGGFPRRPPRPVRPPVGEEGERRHGTNPHHTNTHYQHVTCHVPPQSQYQQP